MRKNVVKKMGRIGIPFIFGQDGRWKMEICGINHKVDDFLNLTI
jgi:hypothetical protein